MTDPQVLLSALQAALDLEERAATELRQQQLADGWPYRAEGDANPAAVLRRIAADRRVLARHSPVPCRDCPADRRHMLCSGCGAVRGIAWPACPEIEDLADRLGVTIQEDSGV